MGRKRGGRSESIQMLLGLVILLSSVSMLAGGGPGNGIAGACAKPVAMPILAELGPARELELGPVADLEAYNAAEPEIPAVGFTRAFEPQVLVDFGSESLPLDLPAEFARGMIEGEEGRHTWTALVKVDGAKSLALRLAEVDLPEDALLRVFAPGRAAEESFGPGDVDPEGSLWSPVVPGQTVVLEVAFPAGTMPRGSIVLSGVQEHIVPVEAGREESSVSLLAPAAPSNLTATPGTREITLNWKDNSIDEKGFKVQRRISGSNTYAKIATVAANTTAYTDSSVTPGVQYTYRVKSYNGSGAAASNTISAIAGKPGAFTLTGTGECSNSVPRVSLSWTASEGAVNYGVIRDEYYLTVVPPATTSYNDDTASPGTTHTYWIKASDNVQQWTASNTITATVPSSCCQGPPAPVLTAMAGCTGNAPKVSLTWTASSGASSYDVYRGGVLVTGGLTGLSYTDTGVSFGQSYSYTVAARNSCTTTNSNPANVTVPSSCCVLPGSFTLTLTAACHNNAPAFSFQFTASSGADTYSSFMDGSFKESNLRPGIIYWVDEVNAGSTHSFFIRAFNSCGQTDTASQSATAPASCCTPPGGLTLTASGNCVNSAPGITFSFTASSGATSHDLYVDNALVSQGLQPNQSLAVTTLPPGTTHTLLIRATNSCGQTDSNGVTATVPTSCGSPPGSFTLNGYAWCKSDGTAVIQLQWTASSGATTYDLYRNSALFRPGLTNTGFIDDPVPIGSEYTYALEAKNASGTTDSNSITIRAPANCGSGVNRVVDETYPTFTKEGPSNLWMDMNNTGWASHAYRWASGGGQAKARWNFSSSDTPPSAGTYQVWAYIGCNQTTTNAVYYYVHGTTQDVLAYANQSAMCNQWRYLYDHYFAADGQDQILLTDNTGEPAGMSTIWVDAIMLVQ